jgi:outer membrane protein TolC
MVSAEPHALSEPRVYNGPPLSLDEALAEAASENPDIVVLRRQADVARQRPAAARALSPPTITTDIWQWPLTTIDPANVNMYMVTLSQEVPGRGKRKLAAAVADQDVTLAERDVDLRVQQIFADVKDAYATLFVTRRAIDIHDASAALLQEVADVAQAKYSAGRLSQQDVLKAVVELSTLHGDVLVFEEQAALASAHLNALLGRPPDSAIGSLAEPNISAPPLPPPADLQRLAAERSPTLQRARVAIDRADGELALAKQDGKPDFMIQGGYMLLPHMADAWTASLGITWPTAPWSRGKVDAHVAEALAAVAAAKADASAQENAVRLAVQEAYVRVQSATDRAALYRTTILPQAQQTLDASRVAYQNDRVDFQALIDNERTVLEAQLMYVRALSDEEQARADLDRATGMVPSATPAPAVAEDEER